MYLMHFYTHPTSRMKDILFHMDYFAAIFFFLQLVLYKYFLRYFFVYLNIISFGDAREIYSLKKLIFI